MPSGTLLSKSTPVFDPTWPLYTEVFPLVGSLLVTRRTDSQPTLLSYGCVMSLCVSIFFIFIFLVHLFVCFCCK